MKISLYIVLSLLLLGCSESVIKENEKGDKVIYLSVLSDPESADVFWRITSNTEEVKSTNRFYLGSTPYRKTKNIDIPGLSNENAKYVTIVLEIEKKGYLDKIERFNMLSVLTNREISTKYHLLKGNGSPEGKTKAAKKNLTKKSKLSAPQGVRASDGKYIDRVKVVWKKVKEASKYDIYRSTTASDKSMRKIGSSKRLSYSDRSALPFKSYYYRVKAYKGREASPFSSTDKGFRKRQNPKKKANGQEGYKNKSSGTGSSGGSVGGGSVGAGVPALAIPALGFGAGAVIGGGSKKKKEIEKDKYEINNKIKTSTTIFLGRNYDATIHKASDVDYYKLYLDGKTKYTITIESLTSSMSYKVEVLSEKKVLYTSKGESISVLLKDQGEKSGTYYIKVTGSKGKYKIKVSL